MLFHCTAVVFVESCKFNKCVNIQPKGSCKACALRFGASQPQASGQTRSATRTVGRQLYRTSRCPAVIRWREPDPLKAPGMIARKFQPSSPRQAGILHTPARPYRCSVKNVFVFFYVSRCLPFYRFLTARASLWQLRILRNIWLYGRDWKNVLRLTWVSAVSFSNKKGTAFFCCLAEMGWRISSSAELIRPRSERDNRAMTDIIFVFSSLQIQIIALSSRKNHVFRSHISYPAYDT